MKLRLGKRMNEATGMSAIEGKAAMGSGERCGSRASFKHGSEEESFACHLFNTSVLISVHPWLPFCRDAQECRDNARAREECPA